MSTWKDIFILWMMVHTTTSNHAKGSCAPIFETRMITLNAKMSLEYVGRNERDSCICRGLPKVYTVCFTANDRKMPCAKFPKNISINTKALLLESTSIEKFELGDFAYLTMLEVFAVNGNQKFNKVEPFVFENMTNLISLSFISNPSLSFLDRKTFYGLVNLKEVNLMRNGFYNIGALVKTLTPKILPTICRANLNENKFLNISEHDFKVMKGSLLVELDLNSCRIENIHSRSLKPLKHLQILRIGNNRLESNIITELLNDTLTAGIMLKYLDLQSSGFRGSLPTPLLKIVSQSNISSLGLSRNQIDIVDNNTFPILSPNLVSIDFSDASLQKIDEEAFSALPNLKTLLIGMNRLSFFAASNHLSNLTYLDIRGNSHVYGTEFLLNKSKFNRLSLKYLDLQYTSLIFLRGTDFANMTQLRTLNLKNCSILRIDDFVFNDLKNLNLLNLENNRIFYVCKKIPFRIFEGLENLEKLLLGGNGIFEISSSTECLFQHLKNLKYLGLDRNSITSITSKDFAPLINLEVLDVSYNHLSSWDDRVFLNNIVKEFRATANKLTHFSDAMLQDFRNLTHIEVNFNSFICDCRIINKMSTNKVALIGFLDLIGDQNVLCEKSSNKVLNNFIKNITNSALICEKKMSRLVLIIPSSILFFLAAVIGTLLYWYRWHIRYWAFLVKLFLIRKGKVRNVSRKVYATNYQFDAFVSYCSKDRNFVLNLVEMLENHEPYLKLCIYERDFEAGSVISESIREHIEKSRKTLLIVSNSYAKSHWCTWETQIAEHHRLFIENPCEEIVDERIVLIKLGLVDEAHLTPTLKYLLKTRIYLHWKFRDENQGVFWQKLRKCLSSSDKHASADTHNNQTAVGT